MSVGRDQEHALAYVLRLWCVTDGEKVVWRASLQDVRSGERVGFPGLEEAFAYLQQCTAEGTPSPRDRDEGSE
jgi:hypothetical protein